MKQGRKLIYSGTGTLFIGVWFGCWALGRFGETWARAPIIFTMGYWILVGALACLFGIMEMVCEKYPGEQEDPKPIDEKLEREFQNAVNNACSCGGKGPDDGCCPACEVWHRMHGRIPKS